MTGSVRRAVVFSLGQRYLAFVLQLGTSIILARLLSPAETGIFSLAAAAVAIGQLLREFGVGDYIISQRDLSRDKLRAAYGVTIMIAMFIALALWLLAQPLAKAYGEPGVATVLYLMSVNFLLLPLGSVAFAVLSKELAFDKIFVVQTAAGVAGALATIAAAVGHLSYLSPAIGSITGIAVTVLILGFMTPANVFMLPTLRGIKNVLRFGGPLTLGRIIDQSAVRSTDFIVSALLGFHASGLLSKANTLLGGFHEFFNAALIRVATPALARSAASPGALQQAYADAIVLMAVVQWTFFGTLAIFGEEIITVLFGANWLGAVVVMQIGSLSGAIWAPFMLYSSLLTAKREVAWQLRIQLIAAPTLVLCLWLGALQSLEAVAWWTMLAAVVRLALISRALHASCGISTRVVLRALGPTALICACGLSLGFLIRQATMQWGWPAWARLPVGAGLLVIGTALLAWWFDHPIAKELGRLRDSWRARRDPV